MNDLFYLTDEQLARIRPYFPKPHGVPRVDDLRVLSGIIHVLKRGLQWRDAPAAWVMCGRLPARHRNVPKVGCRKSTRRSRTKVDPFLIKVTMPRRNSVLLRCSQRQGIQENLRVHPGGRPWQKQDIIRF